MVKRSQITMFMLLGIVLLVIFGFLFFTSQVVNKMRIQKRVEQISTDISQTSVVKDYVTLCLDKAAKEGLILLGGQGGSIYAHQGGTINKDEAIPFRLQHYGTERDFEVDLNIKKPVAGESPWIFPPDYPVAYRLLAVDHRSLSVIDSLYSSRSLYGNLSLSQLCDREGPNKFGGRLSTCHENFYDRVGQIISIQEQLSYFIANYTEMCADFSTFATLFGYNVSLDLSAGDVKSTVTLGEKDVAIDLLFPLVVRVENYVPVTKTISFTTRVPVRLKRIYGLVYFITQFDSRSIFFNATSRHNISLIGALCKDADDKPVDCLDQSMSIVKYKTVCRLCEKNYTDVIQIIDRASNLAGNPYIFQFAVENRNPALDYIGQAVTDEELAKDYDVFYSYKRPIELTPKAEDPDEDTTFFSYHGWKADYEEQWGVTADNSVEIIKTPLTPPDQNQWHASDPYQNTRRDATIQLTDKDIGPHNVTIMVKDDEGLWDSQKIRMVIYDDPDLHSNGTNMYDDIDDDRGSIEDPYVLDARRAGTILGQIISNFRVDYEWKDLFEGVQHGPVSTPRYILPSDAPDIITIPLESFKRDFFEEKLATTPAPQKHEILLNSLLFGQGGAVAQEKVEVDVYKCLPHRNSSYSYPFHLYFKQMDPFQANHTCCKDGIDSWGTIVGKNENKECFRLEESMDGYYMCGRPIQDTFYPPAKEGAYALKNTSAEFKRDESNYPSGSAGQNDVYKREFTVMCGGERGNICNGTSKDIWEIVNPTGCTDLVDGGQDERCKGCDRYGLSNPRAGCTVYPPGKTFESVNKDALGLTGTRADGICNNHWKCTDNVDGKYYDRTQDTEEVEFIAQAFCKDGVCKFVKHPSETHNGNIVTQSCDSFDKYEALGSPPYTKRATTYCVEKSTIPPGSLTDSSIKPETFYVTRDYYCSANSDANQDDKCAFRYVDLESLDGTRKWCGACASKGVELIKAGETGLGGYVDVNLNIKACCGDDINENVILEEQTGENFCCNKEDDCVDDSECFDDATSRNIGETAGLTSNRADYEICHTNKWYDQDSVNVPDGIGGQLSDGALCLKALDGSSLENACNLGSCWVEEGETVSFGGYYHLNQNDVTAGCCGDDENENFVTRGIGTKACCKSGLPNICVDSGNDCRDEYPEEQTCNDGLDNDCDGEVDCEDDDCLGKTCDSGAVCIQNELCVTEYCQDSNGNNYPGCSDSRCATNDFCDTTPSTTDMDGRCILDVCCTKSQAASDGSNVVCSNDPNANCVGNDGWKCGNLGATDGWEPDSTPITRCDGSTGSCVICAEPNIEGDYCESGCGAPLECDEAQKSLTYDFLYATSSKLCINACSNACTTVSKVGSSYVCGCVDGSSQCWKLDHNNNIVEGNCNGLVCET